MNTSKLSRATVVLHRETHEDLAYIAGRMGVTRSALVRDLVTEPLALMAKWVRAVPADVKPEDLARLEQLMGEDVVAFVDAKTRDLEVGHG